MAAGASSAPPSAGVRLPLSSHMNIISKDLPQAETISVSFPGDSGKAMRTVGMPVDACSLETVRRRGGRWRWWRSGLGVKTKTCPVRGLNGSPVELEQLCPSPLLDCQQRLYFCYPRSILY